MKRHIIALLIFIILTAVFTFPLILKMDTSCPGFSSTDELLAPVWNYWYWQYSLRNGVNHWETDIIAYPFGMKIYGDFSPFVYSAWIALLSTVFNHIAVLNIQILLNFILTGFFMYLLVYEVSKSRMAGVLSGIIFTFSPQHFMRSWQHITLSYFQWMPLYIFALFKLKEFCTLKRAVYAGLALFLVASFDLHYLFFMFVATLLFAGLAVIYNRSGFKRILKYLFVTGALSFVLTMSQFYKYVLRIFFEHSGVSSAQNILSRPFEDLFAQSARPLSYLLPSTEHPILGSFTKMFVGSPLYGNSLTEHNLYLGISVLIMAFVGARLYIKRKKEDGTSRQEQFAFRFFFWLAVVSWVFSQPPWWNILGIKFPMPSLLIYKFLPMVRGYCRFGVLLSLSLAVLAGFGLKYWFKDFHSQAKKRLILGCICLVVIFDFWNDPSSHVIDLSRYNKAYDWIREQKGDFVIAEYPLDTGGPNDFYKYFQTIHEKRMINGTVPGTPANDFARTIVKLSGPDTVRKLRGSGVKYVLVHTDSYLDSGLIEDKEELAKIPLAHGLKLIKSFPDRVMPIGKELILQRTGPVDVYEIIPASDKIRAREK